MVGRTYLERGRPVVVVARWAGNGCPRNVWIRREDGTDVVRPFRGLRKISGENVTGQPVSEGGEGARYASSPAPRSTPPQGR